MKYCLWSPDGSTENIERTVDRKLGCEPASLIEMTAENAAYVYTVRYTRYGQPINYCPRPR